MHNKSLQLPLNRMREHYTQPCNIIIYTNHFIQIPIPNLHTNKQIMLQLQLQLATF